MEQKNLITVITDNHLMADTIAKAICATETHDGYYLGNGYACLLYTSDAADDNVSG